jgi:hypothetical protein
MITTLIVSPLQRMAASLLGRSIQIMRSKGLPERPVDGFRSGRCSTCQQERREDRVEGRRG